MGTTYVLFPPNAPFSLLYFPLVSFLSFSSLLAPSLPLPLLLGRDVNKATDSKAKAKAKATPCKAKAKAEAEAEAEAEASVPWHKLVIMHNFLKTFLQYFKPFSFRCFRLIL